MFARFDENPAMTLQDIKKTKRYGWTDGRTHGRTHTRTHTRTDNVKTVYPTTNKVCGGYNYNYFLKDQTKHMFAGFIQGSLSKIQGLLMTILQFQGLKFMKNPDLSVKSLLQKC